MPIDANKHMKKILENMDLIKPSDIPNIDLYMDQVTTFMENHLGKLKRFEDDKILTKTMINNYAKNDLLPPPEKKKYSKDHVLLLTFIYYFKSFLPIIDIKTLTNKLNSDYFHSDKEVNLEAVYTELLNNFPELLDTHTKHVLDLEKIASESFSDKCDDDYLKKFMFISLLGMDVYMKKQLIENIIDSMEPPLSKKEAKKENKTKNDI